MITKAVIDFDTPIFTACLKGQGDLFDINEEFDTPIDYEVIKELIDTSLTTILFETGATDFSLHITGEGNFRYSILPSYKWRRKHLAKPIALKWAKEYIKEKYGNKCVWEDNVEADDTAVQDFTNIETGITKILCHIDKDLNQVAGKHYNYNTNVTYKVSEEEANAYLWTQVITGDEADCYRGCPNVGGVKAEKIINEGLRVSPLLYTYSKGAKKGQSEVRWIEYEDINSSILDRVLDWYIKGYYTKGGFGSELGHNTKSGFKEDVKIDIDWHLGKHYISKADILFLQKEIEKMYTIVRMLHYGEATPKKAIKLF